jgi:hypothetical protein
MPKNWTTKDQVSAPIIRALIECADEEPVLSGMGSPWREIGQSLSSCPRSPAMRRNAFETIIDGLGNQEIIRQLVYSNPAEAAASVVNAAPAPPRPEKNINLGEYPPLPPSVKLPDHLAANACPWLDAYIAFSGKWSPRAYTGFHESCGLWLLSTVAARRVMIQLGKPRFTSLYIILAGRTSVHAKSTTAEVAIATLRQAGLDWLLVADNTTPQKFIKDMNTCLPDGYDAMSDEQKARMVLRLVMAGQRGWFYDEFGMVIAAMMRDGGFMADFRGILRRFDDTPESYEYGTIGRGSSVVERPYLALLANLTPADLRPFARRGAALWGDGFLARFVLASPPEGSRRRNRLPREKRIIPAELTNPLRRWHERLGIPKASIQEKSAEKGEPASRQVSVQPAAAQVLEIRPEVYEAFYAYDDAMSEIMLQSDNTDLDGNYARHAEKALRISALLASMSGSERVSIQHWARAQQVAELWRADLHELYRQVNESQPSQAHENEERVLRVIEKQGRATRRVIRQYTRLTADEIERMLRSLVYAGLVEEIPGEKTTYYGLPKDAAGGESVDM